MHKPTAPLLAAVILLAAAASFWPVPAPGETASGTSPEVEIVKPKWEPCLPFVPKGCEVALVKGDYTKGASQIVYRMPANFAVPEHWHTAPERMVVMAGRIRMAYPGRQPEVLETGDTTQAAGKVPHAAFCLRGTPCVVMVEYDLPFDATPVVAPK